MLKILIYKDLLQAFKDKKGLMLSFLLPIVLIALFALVYGGFDNGVTDRPQDLVLCNEDNSLLSKKLVKALEQEKGLHVISSLDQNKGKKAVLDGDYTAMFLIQEGFGDSIQQNKTAPLVFFYDESRKMEMGLTQQALMGIVMPFLGNQSGQMQIHEFIDKNYVNELPREIIDEIHQDIELQFSEDTEPNTNASPIKTQALSVKKNMPWGLIQAFAGTSVMMLLFSIASMGSALLQERENGTLKRMLYSPLQPWQIISGRLLSSFVFALLQMTILILFTYLVFGLDVFRNFSGLLLITIATAFAAAGMGILLAAVAKTQKQLESLAMITIIVMSALGGSMIPLFIFPDFLKTMAHFTINFWSIDGFYDVLGRDVGLWSHLKNAGILLLFGLISSLLAIGIFTNRLKKDFQ